MIIFHGFQDSWQGIRSREREQMAHARQHGTFVSGKATITKIMALPVHEAKIHLACQTGVLEKYLSIAAGRRGTRATVPEIIAGHGFNVVGQPEGPGLTVNNDHSWY